MTIIKVLLHKGGRALERDEADFPLSVAGQECWVSLPDAGEPSTPEFYELIRTMLTEH